MAIRGGVFLMLLRLVLHQLCTPATSVLAFEPLLLPDESLCGQEYYTNGLVIEASHFVSTWKYFSCDIKFKTNYSTDSNFRWILRIERMFIPYAIVDQLVAVPPAIHVHTSNETFIIQYKKDFADLIGVTFSTQKLGLQFVNLPQESSYKFVITLDTGDKNCSSGFKCPDSGYCIDSNLLCDGENHCGGSEDELDTVCPDETDVVPIVIVASGSVLLALLVGLAVALVVRCRSKRATHYNQWSHHNHIAAMSKRATFIREPRQSALTSSSSAADLNKAPRRCGVGYQPAVVVLRQSSSTSTVFAAVHSKTDRHSTYELATSPLTIRSPCESSSSSSSSSCTESVNSASIPLIV